MSIVAFENKVADWLHQINRAHGAKLVRARTERDTMRRRPQWTTSMSRPLRDVCYLWRQPARLRNRKLIAYLGVAPHSNLDAAAACTLRALE